MKKKLSDILLKELEIEIENCTNPKFLEIDDLSDKEDNNGESSRESKYQIAA